MYAVLMSGAGSVAVVMERLLAIVPLYACDALTELPSVAVMVKLYAPAAVGVPLIAPVEVSRLKPVGNAPDVTLKVTGAVPPEVCTVWLYALLSTGVGSVAVVIEIAETIAPLYDFEAVTEFASVAVTANAYAPAADGVPLIAPVDASSDRPAGNAPDVMLKVTGAVPPEVCTVWLYAAFMSGVGSVAVVIAIADTIEPLYDFEAVTKFASVAVTVKLYAPAALGVPPIAPVDVSSVSPAGSDPAVTANVTGAVPPDVCTV